MSISTKGRYARITKIGVAENAQVPAANSLSEITPGQLHPTLGLPIDYWVEGTFYSDIVEGQSVTILRKIRNGVEVPGIFTTSPVATVTNDKVLLFRTANSDYIVEFKEENSESTQLVWN